MSTNIPMRGEKGKDTYDDISHVENECKDIQEGMDDLYTKMDVRSEVKGYHDPQVHFQSERLEEGVNQTRDKRIRHVSLVRIVL